MHSVPTLDQLLQDPVKKGNDEQGKAWNFKELSAVMGLC